jgi:ABC-type lipoprotein release transport system permease subunit
MIVGLGVKEAFAKSFYDKYFNFILPNGELKRVNITSTFSSSTRLFSNDVVLLNIDIAKEILGLNEDECSDIIIKVSNKLEINNIKAKLTALYPNSKIISKEDIISANGSLFDYKSGLFLMMIVIALFTFFMIIYDKSSGLSGEEKKEIGILKAIGWTIDDILKEKFYESFIISLISYLLGIIIAFSFVYIFQAPILKDIFIGYDGIKTTFNLPFVFDFQTLFLVFFLSVPIYISATIIPSWKTSTLETDEIIR